MEKMHLSKVAPKKDWGGYAYYTYCGLNIYEELLDIFVTEHLEYVNCRTCKRLYETHPFIQL